MACCNNLAGPAKDLAIESLATRNLCAKIATICGTLTVGTVVVPTSEATAGVDALVIGPTGITGPIGPSGLSIVGPEGPIGLIGPQGLTIVGPDGIAGEIGPQGIQGLIGPEGLTVVGPAGITGEIGPQGIQGLIGPEGLTVVGPTGIIGEIGPQGIQGLIGPAGLTIVGPDGIAGEIGPQGIQGLIGPEGLSIVGPTGPIGSIGPPGISITGPQGIQGLIGPTGLSNIIAAGMYAQLGAQPASVAASQPLTFSTTILSTPSITPLVALGGTVFQLATISRYEVNYQVTFPTNGGIVLFTGSTLGTMLPLAYTMLGKSSNSGQVSGSMIIATTTANSFLSVNAAPGNTAALQPGTNSSATNQNSTTVSIKQI